MWIYGQILSFQNIPVRLRVGKVAESFISWVSLMGNTRHKQEEANSECHTARAKSHHYYSILCLFEMLRFGKDFSQNAHVSSHTSARPTECCSFLNLDSLCMIELNQAFKQIAVQFLKESPWVSAS